MSETLRMPTRLVRQIGRKIIRRWQGAAIILTYHRVAVLPRDPQLLAVTPVRFAEQLEVIRRDWHPIGLRALTKAIAQERVPHRAVCITLDDGYRDNLIEAKPLLDRADIPATVFVASGSLDCDAIALSNEIESLILEPSTLPESFRVTIGDSEQHWSLGNYTQQEAERDRAWNVFDSRDPSLRHSAYRALHAQLHRLSPAGRRSAIAALRTAVGAPQRASVRRMMSETEVARLAGGGLIEIGAHTVNHPKLCLLDMAEQQREISESKSRLESIVGAAVTSFAYPYGTHEDYDGRSVSLVREAGFERACSIFGGVVTRRSSIFELPRFVVRDWDGDTLAKALRRWYG
jgi:peptidoglycan/xylan/chitin deacetylase (PgdA/CDA1 family)